MIVSLNIRRSDLAPIIRRLQEADLITEVWHDHTGRNQGLLLTTDPARIHLVETLGAIETQGFNLKGENRISLLINQLGEIGAKRLDAMTLRDLVDDKPTRESETRLDMIS